LRHVPQFDVFHTPPHAGIKAMASSSTAITMVL
jgi:hypothetical protein